MERLKGKDSYFKFPLINQCLLNSILSSAEILRKASRNIAWALHCLPRRSGSSGGKVRPGRKTDKIQDKRIIGLYMTFMERGRLKLLSSACLAFSVCFGARNNFRKYRENVSLYIMYKNKLQKQNTLSIRLRVITVSRQF